MLFNDKLKEKHNIIAPEFEKLLQIALKSQTHPGDLLLFYVNGFYDEFSDSIEENGKKKFDPHVIGLGKEGHSDADHYNFIHDYRSNNVLMIPFAQHLENVKWDASKKDEIEAIIRREELSIQIEMLIYLKIWEADAFLKKLYELSRIINGESYDWYFKIGKGKGNYKYFEKRHEIIRIHVRDKIKEIIPTLSQVIKETYISQLRNAIAHSQYWFLSRKIALNNHIENDINSNLTTVTFENWADIFHNTLNIHNLMIGLSQAINNYYGEFAMKNDNRFPIRITTKEGQEYERYLYYRSSYKDWGWYPTK